MQFPVCVCIHLVHFLRHQCLQNIDWQQNMYLSQPWSINQQGHEKKSLKISITSVSCPWICQSTGVYDFCQRPASEMHSMTKLKLFPGAGVVSDSSVSFFIVIEAEQLCWLRDLHHENKRLKAHLRHRSNSPLLLYWRKWKEMEMERKITKQKPCRPFISVFLSLVLLTCLFLIILKLVEAILNCII